MGRAVTLAELRKARPNAAAAYSLAVIERLGAPETARRMGESVGTVKTWVRRARQLLGASPLRDQGGQPSTEEAARVEARLTQFGRCTRCALLLPCVCLPEIEDVAISRPGPGAMFPAPVPPSRRPSR